MTDELSRDKWVAGGTFVLVAAFLFSCLGHGRNYRTTFLWRARTTAFEHLAATFVRTKYPNRKFKEKLSPPIFKKNMLDCGMLETLVLGILRTSSQYWRGFWANFPFLWINPFFSYMWCHLLNRSQHGITCKNLHRCIINLNSSEIHPYLGIFRLIPIYLSTE